MLIIAKVKPMQFVLDAVFLIFQVKVGDPSYNDGGKQHQYYDVKKCRHIKTIHLDQFLIA
ncbi:hypothetical protein SDC9_115298 [bioreactor metagenome]|uniref:Uncharacterized protein n=1 Tax=bioreactor metagenome TaxID=1076179 RepID=A0A645BSL5_9ZZZZ